MSEVIRPVVLSGGAGTRLWPLSTPERPKQFLDLVGEPLIAQAFRRLVDVPGCSDPVVVTGVEHVPLVEAALEDAGIRPHRMISEPIGRNTAPAVIAAALVVEPADVLVVLPADQIVVDHEGFTAVVTLSIPTAEAGALVTFGVVPERAETGYGYIEKGKARDNGFEVESFTEKPDMKTAQTMASDGRHLWNSGIFMFTAGALLDEARRLVPELTDGVAAAIPAGASATVELSPAFAGLEAVSLDHALMERTNRAVVVPMDVGWTDLGSWQSLWEASAKDADGNVEIGDVVTSRVTGSYIRSGGRRIAVAGVDDVVIVETPDAVLVLGLDRAQDVRALAAAPPRETQGD